MFKGNICEALTLVLLLFLLGLQGSLLTNFHSLAQVGFNDALRLALILLALLVARELHVSVD